MRLPRVRFTVRRLMGVVVAAAIALLLVRTDTMLGAWGIGISLPAFVWTLDAGGRANAKAPRRRPSLGLRESMLLVLCLGLWLGWQARLARQQREAVAAIEEYGGFVRFDWESVDGKPVPGAAPRAPGWLRRAIGDHYFQEVAEVNMVYSTDRRGMPALTPRQSDALMANLTAFPRLRHLYIGGELATDRAMDTIGGLAELETLMMWEARVTDAGVAKARGLRNLKVLQLDNAGLGDNALAHLASLVRLEHLDLGGISSRTPGWPT
jgi:hypothetical protein